MNDGIEILLEDGPVLALMKPAGLLTEGPKEVDSLVRRTKEFLKIRGEKPGNVYLGVPHRLDRCVSGVILLAKNSKAAARLAEQIRDRQVRKTYWALLPAPPEPLQGSFVDWIEKFADQPKGRVVDAPHPAAQEAILHYQTLRVTPAGWLVEVELTTGRFHQIRIQFAARGLPILGDEMYGSSLRFGDEMETESIALHARSIAFLHPVRYDLTTVVAPLLEKWHAAGVGSES